MNKDGIDTRGVLKIYGERNSNTNHLSVLLRKNCGAVLVPGTAPEYLQWSGRLAPISERLRDLYFAVTQYNNLGWKHRLPPARPLFDAFEQRTGTRLTVVTLSKDPYAWLLSLHRRPYHLGVRSDHSFEEFLRRRFVPLGREGMAREALSPTELWNAKTRGYLEVDFPRCLHIASEDILRDQRSVVSQIAEFAGLATKSDQIEAHHASTSDASKSTDHYADYYLNRRWEASISIEAATIINSQLDRELVSRLGYSLFEPTVTT